MDLGISQVLCSLVFFSFCFLSPELISVFAMKERDPHPSFQLLLQLHPTCLKHTLLNTCSGPGVVDTSTWRKLDEPKMSAYCVRNVLEDREQRRKRAGRGWGSVMEQVMRTEIPAFALAPSFTLPAFSPSSWRDLLQIRSGHCWAPSPPMALSLTE